jgi:hypothetical protein
VAQIETVHLLDFVRELEPSVTSIALGEARVAVLAGEPWVKDREKWRKEPVPGGLDESARIFFGRDDRPRLMGGRDAPLYLRLKRAGWQREPSEIGRLSGGSGGLFGVLGYADPEVVCQVGGECIIKRRTGWRTIAAPAGAPRVGLCEGGAYAAGEGSLLRLGADGWQPAATELPVQRAAGFWIHGNGTIWVADATDPALYHYDGRQWTRMGSPVGAPGELWATGPTDLWLVGEVGAAHYDGSTWRRVDGPAGGLRCIVGRGAQDLWVGGSSGLWHGTAK